MAINYTYAGIVGP